MTDSRISAGVVIIGCPDFLALMSQRAGPESDKLLPKSFRETVRRLSPSVGEVSKKDILILKGEDDQLIPWKACRNFVDRLPASKMEIVGYPGVGHELYPGMDAKTLDWIHKWRLKN
jgi:predicted esterase